MFIFLNLQGRRSVRYGDFQYCEQAKSVIVVSNGGKGWYLLTCLTLSKRRLFYPVCGVVFIMTHYILMMQSVGHTIYNTVGDQNIGLWGFVVGHLLGFSPTMAYLTHKIIFYKEVCRQFFPS